MDQAQELLDMPKEFIKDGRLFITRCSKREYRLSYSYHDSMGSLLLTIRDNSRQEGIFAHLASRRHGVLDHGCHWLRGKIDSYPREQHPSGRRLRESAIRFRPAMVVLREEGKITLSYATLFSLN
nr:hypothetical protein CFP56_20570 [Quercus suber]